MKRFLAFFATAVVAVTALAACAPDRTEMPGDIRSVAELAEAFPEIDVAPLESIEADGDLHIVELEKGWNLTAQTGGATALIGWFTDHRDLANMTNEWAPYKGVDQEIWMLMTGAGKVTIVSLRTSLP